jgi:hypothetical protein
MLPDMDGVTWIGKLRDAGNDTPIAFISGHWCDRSTFNWLRNILKVSLVLQKPVLPEIFRRGNRQHLAPGRLPGSTETEYLDHSSGQFPGRPVSRVSMVDVECENIRQEYPKQRISQSGAGAIRQS